VPTTTRIALAVRFAGPPGDGLLRVLTLLRRRGCVIEAVEFDVFAPGLDIVVAAPAARSHLLTRWLDNLIDVEEARARVADRVEAPSLQPVGRHCATYARGRRSS
jgi:acetolactate synthase regulatory subunit